MQGSCSPVDVQSLHVVLGLNERMQLANRKVKQIDRKQVRDDINQCLNKSAPRNIRRKSPPR